MSFRCAPPFHCNCYSFYPEFYSLLFFTFQNLTYPSRASSNATTFMKFSLTDPLNPQLVLEFLPFSPNFPCRCLPSRPWTLSAFACCGFELCQNGNYLRQVQLKQCVCYIKTHLINSSLKSVPGKNLLSQIRLFMFFYQTVKTSYGFPLFTSATRKLRVKLL